MNIINNCMLLFDETKPSFIETVFHSVQGIHEQQRHNWIFKRAIVYKYLLWTWEILLCNSFILFISSLKKCEWEVMNSLTYQSTDRLPNIQSVIWISTFHFVDGIYIILQCWKLHDSAARLLWHIYSAVISPCVWKVTKRYNLLHSFGILIKQSASCKC